jgi:hypothetical protein
MKQTKPTKPSFQGIGFLGVRPGGGDIHFHTATTAAIWLVDRTAEKDLPRWRRYARIALLTVSLTIGKWYRSSRLLAFLLTPVITVGGVLMVLCFWLADLFGMYDYDEEEF